MYTEHQRTVIGTANTGTEDTVVDFPNPFIARESNAIGQNSMYPDIVNKRNYDSTWLPEL